MNWQDEMEFDITFPGGVFAVDDVTGAATDITDDVKTFVSAACERAVRSKRQYRKVTR